MNQITTCRTLFANRYLAKDEIGECFQGSGKFYMDETIGVGGRIGSHKAQFIEHVKQQLK